MIRLSSFYFFIGILCIFIVSDVTAGTYRCNALNTNRTVTYGMKEIKIDSDNIADVINACKGLFPAHFKKERYKNSYGGQYILTIDKEDQAHSKGYRKLWYSRIELQPGKRELLVIQS